MKIDGKVRILCNRKYCLECHPFGWRGRHREKSSSRASNNEGISCVCENCGRNYFYTRYKGHTLKICNSCLVNRRRFVLKQRAVEYKGGCCIKCEYNSCLDALTFHHVDPDEKDFNISGAHSRAWEVIRAELDKCVLLCIRCHIELEAGMWGL